MPKLHTRQKRKISPASHLRHRVRVKKKRARTFKTEAAAIKYAETKGIKSYELVNLKNTEAKEKKIKIISK